MKSSSRWLTVVAVLACGTAMAGPDGQALYTKNCTMCHQTGGTGLAGQFPRLSGRVGPISAKPEGRDYLIDVLGTGMAGQVTVDATPIIGVMPGFPQLEPEEVAAILTYVASLGGKDGKPISAADVTKRRAAGQKTTAQVLDERRKLVAAGVVK